jgi:hypothetical protein
MIIVKRVSGNGWPKAEMAMEKLARSITRVANLLSVILPSSNLLAETNSPVLHYL